ncbi:MAG: methionine synthase, partial [Actinomycetota bacterium]|nr:methionine synthase [Actinomycetota bacterium]
VDGPEVDYIAMQAVTMGPEVSRRTAELFASNDYGAYLRLHGLGVEMAEALAEFWHHRIRTEWGFVAEDGESLAGLFRQKYRGGRYSFGYPACPRLEDNEKLVNLLGAKGIGIEVSEGFQLHPEQSTTAIVCHHPQAKYFVA